VGQNRLFRNTGKGTFVDVTKTSGLDRRQAFSTSAMWFDFDRDGRLDLVVTSGLDGTVWLLRGDGSGRFSKTLEVRVGTSPRGLAAGDFNGDGKLDLAVANQDSNTVSVLIGDGAGAFSTPTSISVSAAPTALVTADFNRDGRPDLAVANQGSNNVAILLGHGDGTFGVH
jgi:hypothetical protein